MLQKHIAVYLAENKLLHEMPLSAVQKQLEREYGVALPDTVNPKLPGGVLKVSFDDVSFEELELIARALVRDPRLED